MKVHGIKRAVGDFNRWVGSAKIMMNTRTCQVWVDVFDSIDGCAQYDDNDVVTLVEKQGSAKYGGQLKITIAEVEDRARYCEESGKSWG